MAAEVITALYVMLSRRIDPVNNALLSFGTINGGTAFNILADEVVMTGTCRALDPEVERRFPELINEVAGGVAGLYGAEVDLDYNARYPPLLNDDGATAVLEEAAKEAIGASNVKAATPLMAGDDLAYFLQEVPGSYFWLGITNPEKGAVHPAHTARFTIDESALTTGVAVMLQAVKASLEGL